MVVEKETYGRTDGRNDQPTRLLEFHMLYGTNNIYSFVTQDFLFLSLDPVPTVPSSCRPAVSNKMSAYGKNQLGFCVGTEGDESAWVTYLLRLSCKLCST